MVFFFFLSGKFIELNMVGFPLPCLINYKRARILSVLIVSQMCVHIKYVYNIYIYIIVNMYSCIVLCVCIFICVFSYAYTYIYTHTC